MTVENPTHIGQSWLSRFEHFLAHKLDVDTLSTVLRQDGFWRDVCAAQWHSRAPRGVDAVHAWLESLPNKEEIVAKRLGISSSIRCDPSSSTIGPVPWSKTKEQVVVVSYTFDVEQDRGGKKPFQESCNGIAKLRLDEQDGQWKAEVIFHQLCPSETRQSNVQSSTDNSAPVIIVGAGHAGLGCAAYLRGQGIESVVLERAPQVGLQWDSRAETLKLHTPKRFNTMPYLDYPEHYPQEMTKRHFAEFLRSYASTLKLNVRTSTQMVPGSASYADGKWTMDVEQEGKRRYTMTCRHLILAAGMHAVARPIPPSVASSTSFAGRVMHACDWPAWEQANKGQEKGKRVVVIGMGNTGSDIGRDCCNRGAAEVTMVQRGQICAASTALLHLVSEKAWPSKDEERTMKQSDLLVNSTPPLLFREQLRSQVGMLDKPFDKTLHEQLQQAGTKLWWGNDESGVFAFAAGSGAGHVWDAGLGQLIGEGKVKVKQGVEVTSVGPGHEVHYSDGSKTEADLVFFATGYEKPKEMVNRLLNEQVNDAVFEPDEEGEVRGIWWAKLQEKPLYAAIGAFPTLRLHGPMLAARIRAEEQGSSA